MEHKRALALVILLLMVQAICDLALPRYTANIVDIGIAGFGPEQTTEQRAYLVGQGIQMLGVTALGALAAIAISFVASCTAAAIGRDLRNRLFSKVVGFSDAEVQLFSAASLITRGTNDVQQIQMVCMVAMRMVLFAPIMAIGGIVMVVRTDVKMSWIIVLAVLVVFGVIIAIMFVALPKFKILQELIDRVNLVAREILTGLPVIRAFNRQTYEEQRFDDANRTLMRTQLFTNRAMVFMQPATQLVMNAVSALIVWVGAGYVDAGTLQTGQMMAFITYSMVIVMSFMMISMIAIMLPRAAVAANRVDEVLTTESSIHDPVLHLDANLPHTPGAQIAFDHVTFAYDEDSEPVLKDVSFVAPAGKTTAFVGSTGSGKSTVFKLIMRLHDARSGTVSIDGIDVRDLTQETLHRQLGYVPQQSFLFSGTIGSNIAYSNEDMDIKRIEQAASIAQASDFVHAKEDGFDTEIAQGGTNVSGGQRQRLAIARALATDARAFLFDDSFSALDYATDAALRSHLGKELEGRTVLIVAQRIATIRNADVIIVLDGGHIVGQGTHEHLIETCNVYRQIAESQLSASELEGCR